MKITKDQNGQYMAGENNIHIPKEVAEHIRLLEISIKDVHEYKALEKENIRLRKELKRTVFTDCWDRLGRRIHDEDYIRVLSSVSGQWFKAQVRLDKGAFKAYYKEGDEWDYLFDIDEQCELLKLK